MESVGGGLPPESASGACDVANGFLAGLASFAHLRAIKLYRLEVEVVAAVPRLPCLDHEAVLHEGAPHVGAYVEDTETGELHELVLIPSRRRIKVDPGSTLHEYTEAGQAGFIARLRARFPDCRVAVGRVSWLRGDRRATRACRAQVTLDKVLSGDDFDDINRGLTRLRAVATLMEKKSRVASWSVRTVTGPFLAAVGFVVYQGLGRLAPELGESAVNALRASVLGVVGAAFLYYGLRAVHLTQMANRVWKRATEYGLIVAERRRLASEHRDADSLDAPLVVEAGTPPAPEPARRTGS